MPNWRSFQGDLWSNSSHLNQFAVISKTSFQKKQNSRLINLNYDWEETHVNEKSDTMLSIKGKLPIWLYADLVYCMLHSNLQSLGAVGLSYGLATHCLIVLMQQTQDKVKGTQQSPIFVCLKPQLPRTEYPTTRSVSLLITIHAVQIPFQIS